MPDNTIAFCSTGCPLPRGISAGAARVRRSRSPAAADCALCEHGAADRLAAERFIAQRYAERFGARITGFMPRLFSLRDRDGAVCGAFGLRAARQRLFIEQYLDEPIEQAIAARTGSPAERASIVEVGHFCGTFSGAMRTMIALLAPRLRDEGFDWVAFAGTTSLCNAFQRVGMQPIHVRCAEPGRLPEAERFNWGSYYDYAPRVLIGRIDDGIRALADAAARAADDARRTA